MKKRVMLILSCLFLGIGFITAQTTRATGIVVDNVGEPVISASVVVKGTTVGVSTDLDGKFSINVPEGRNTLVFSLVGMRPVEAKAALDMRIVMENDEHVLGDVVVTALGIKRSEKAIGYSATSVSGDDLSKSRTADMMSGLAGKVAGVQISSSSGDPGSSKSVIIRGFSSLSGSNQPLYVVDGVPLTNNATYSSDGLNSSYDFGNGANAVNPDDVESMTILKGAAATALYGSRAAGGVILITTKTGQKQRGLGLEYNGGIQFSTILKLPEFQNEYGIGWSGVQTYTENGSWGPKFDGSMQLWGTVYNNSQKIKPYVAMKNNVKDFFDTGFRYSNSISYNGATDKSDYFVSFSQLSDDGLLPTDADTYDKYTFSMRGSYKTGNLKISSSLNYTTQENRFAPTGQGLSMINSLYQMPRDVSIIGLEDQSDPFNTLDYYYTPYGVTNPYLVLKYVQNRFLAEKLYGKVEATYDFLKYFSAIYRLGYDTSNSEIKIGVPQYAKLMDPSSPNYSDMAKNEGTVYNRMDRRREINHDALVTFDMPYGDFQFNAIAGLNINERRSSYEDAQVTGLDNPTWFNITNSPATPVVTEYESLRRLVGVLGQAEIGYKSMLYATLSARNDWSSTLPTENRSFFYPGIATSFVFSEVLSEQAKKVISFGKVRVAWGQTGNDANPYKIYPSFTRTNVNLGFGNMIFPLNGVNAFTQGNTLGSLSLQPEITTEFEVGANVGFFNNRITIDAAYYNRNSDKQIFDLNMDPATGYTFQTMNLGKISNKGIELLVNVRPIELKDFSWDVSWNFTKNKSKVVSLPEELGGSSLIYGLTGGVQLYAEVGKPLGIFKASTVERDPNGNPVVDADGLPIESTDLSIIGDMNYDYEMGFSTTIKYKSVSLRADLDVRQGGLMYSRTKDINYFVGNVTQTLYNDRRTFVVPGSVQKVTNSDGTVTYVENATPVSSSKVGDYWSNGALGWDSEFLIDKSYVKLRSIVLSWDLPRKWLKSTFLQDVNLSAYGNNLFVWTPTSNSFIDPEVTTFGNDLSGRYGEFSANPTTRQFGFNVKVKF
jgi:TonB-linked SusC/RagA family outer membrane protein